MIICRNLRQPFHPVNLF